MAGRHRAQGPRIAVNAARIAVGGWCWRRSPVATGHPGLRVHPEVTSMPWSLRPAITAPTSTTRRSITTRNITMQPGARARGSGPGGRGSSGGAQPEAAIAPESQPDPAMAPEQLLYDHYIVQPGDTLTHIAAAYQIPWESLWAINSDQLPHPDAVFPNQRLRLPPNPPHQ